MPEYSYAEFFRRIYLIRRFEETVLDEFAKGIFHGTTHTYLGQEANAVGVISHLREGDLVFSNHRCHGHFLAYGGEPRALFAEMMGKPGGVCGGVGGSQHIHYRNFYSNGILGGTIPIAVGTALAEKWKQTQAITVTFMGDGALGEGIVYESFNLAALWSAPILFVIENNHIAQTTPTRVALAGSIYERMKGFGLPVLELDTSDTMEIFHQAGKVIASIRSNISPHVLILNTERFGPHSKGDDTRDKMFINEIKSRRDPVEIIGSRLGAEERATIMREVDDAVLSGLNFAKNEPEFDD